MGKPFSEDLKKLDFTYKWSLAQSTGNIRRFVKSKIGRPLICVASGGSLITASFWSILHQELGEFSKFITPLELISSKSLMGNCSVVLISARGNNPDILNALNFAIKNDSKSILILTNNHDGKLLDKCKNDNDISRAIYDHPNLKDGYITTNSLLCMTLILLKSYVELLNVDIKLPYSLTQLINIDSSKTEVEMNFQYKIKPVLEKKSLLILHDKWSKPSALYLQSAFIESGLGYVYISDYRNFAHGIHNWLNKSNTEVSVLALTASTNSDLPTRTLNYLPSKIPKYLLESNWSPPISSLELLIKSMYIVKIKGKQMKIDPGIPNISEFGKKIYNLDIEVTSDTLSPPLMLSDNELTAISRKIGYKFSQTNSQGVEYWKSAYSIFIKKIRNNRFKGIVFDYDGTLVSQDERFEGPCESIINNMVRLLENDITIGIATGRGKSVRMDLEKVIPRQHWQNILIGYYNGSDIGYLNDPSHPNPNKKSDSLLSIIESILKKDEYFSHISKIKLRDKQLSLEPIFPFSIDNVLYYLHSIIIEPEMRNLQFLTSSHSIDILLPDITKLSIVKIIDSFEESKKDELKILTIGDKGRWPGNDFYLLNHTYSLSVNEVSMNPKCCWNLSPAGKYGVQAMLYYFERMQIKDSYVQINFEED